ncbi:MAG TPA: hypothetical protein VGI51_06585 [Steroidobacteraceae bacterium]
MTVHFSSFCSSLSGARRKALAAPLGLALAALAACNGTAVVTMTSTASTDNFLAYRVGLVSVQLQSGGKAGLAILPASTTVDLAKLTDVSEVLGAPGVAKGTYTRALITLDYSSAQIVYDNGSVNGVPLAAVDANGRLLDQVQLTVTLDPSASFTVSSRGTSQLSLDFNLAASNVVDLSRATVTVTPMMAASAMPIDVKPVRIRGPLMSVGNSALTSAGASFTMGIMPFNSSTNGTGQLAVVPNDATAYEINGIESTGSAGLGQLGGLSTGTTAVAYVTMTPANSATTTPIAASAATAPANPTSALFTATQVLAGSSVQAAGLEDRVSGIVLARSGDVVAVEDATLVGADGTDTFLVGTTDVILGPNTLVTVFGQGGGGTELNGPQLVSVGSAIDAFGVATVAAGASGEISGNATLDASAGQIRLDPTTASGLITAAGSGTLNLNLASLGGRSVGPFEFAGTGISAGRYVVNTGTLDLTNSTLGVPVIVTGFPNSFGVTPPDFTASTLLDPTTIQAEMVVDWSAGTTAPFAALGSSAISVDAHNSSIGPRHQIQIGAQAIDVAGLASDPSIVPNTASSNMVFTVGHASSGTTESFNTYASFVARLQAELNGTTRVTGMTAVGQYTASTFSLSATSITLVLNN